MDDALAAAAATLESAGVPDALHDARLMLAHLMGKDLGGLMLYRREPIALDVASRFAEMISRRAMREPLQHVIGIQGFHGLNLKCDARALVPRFETEGLVEAAFELALPQNAVVADLGTGSGCIAIAFAVIRPDVHVYALDASVVALELAGENARLHHVEDRVELVEGDLIAPPASWNAALDLVMSNPPYVPAADWEQLQPEVRDHDPREALVPGPTGLEAYSALAPVAARLLKPGGYVLLELGIDQSEMVRELVSDAGFEDIEVFPDLREIPRVLQGRRP